MTQWAGWKSLFQLHPSITDIEQKRQSQLLAGLSVALFFAGLMGLLSALFNVIRLDHNPTGLLIIWQLPLITAVAFYLNRRGNYVYAAHLSVFGLLETVILLWAFSDTVTALYYLTTLFFLSII